MKEIMKRLDDMNSAMHFRTSTEEQFPKPDRIQLTVATIDLTRKLVR